MLPGCLAECTRPLALMRSGRRRVRFVQLLETLSAVSRPDIFRALR